MGLAGQKGEHTLLGAGKQGVCQPTLRRRSAGPTAALDFAPRIYSIHPDTHFGYLNYPNWVYVMGLVKSAAARAVIRTKADCSTDGERWMLRTTVVTPRLLRSQV